MSPKAYIFSNFFLSWLAYEWVRHQVASDIFAIKQIIKFWIKQKLLDRSCLLSIAAVAAISITRYTECVWKGNNKKWKMWNKNNRQQKFCTFEPKHICRISYYPVLLKIKSLDIKFSFFPTLNCLSAPHLWTNISKVEGTSIAVFIFVVAVVVV